VARRNAEHQRAGEFSAKTINNARTYLAVALNEAVRPGLCRRRRGS
jgi:hypothetical protein